MRRRTTGLILHDVVGEIETTGGALRRLSDLLSELAKAIVTGPAPEPDDSGHVIDLDRIRERDRR